MSSSPSVIVVVYSQKRKKSVALAGVQPNSDRNGEKKKGMEQEEDRESGKTCTNTAEKKEVFVTEAQGVEVAAKQKITTTLTA